MKNYRYILEPYAGKNTRFHCPQCQHKRKTFTRYVDTRTGEYAGELYGKCDRLVNCNYHSRPHAMGNDIMTQGYSGVNKLSSSVKNHVVVGKIYSSSVNKSQKPSYIPKEQLIQSIPIHLPYEKQLTTNHLLNNLHQLFNRHGEGQKIVSELIKRYYIGTGDCKQTLFFQIDLNNKIRTAKIMTYDPKTGRRVKSKGASWLHTQFKNFNLKQCLFGEHLLRKYPNKPVAIVESEKTAIIASVYIPGYKWLACGSLQNLKAHKYRDVLKDKHIILFPDLSKPNPNKSRSAYQLWKEESKLIDYAASIQVSNVLEQHATSKQKEEGLDLADFLIQFDYQSFSLERGGKPEVYYKPNQPKLTDSLTEQVIDFIPYETYLKGVYEENGMIMYQGYPASWDSTAPYVNEKSKQLIRLCERNSKVLEMIRVLELKIM